MVINTETLRMLNDNLEHARTALAKAEKDYKAVHSLCGQDGYSITINGVRLEVAEMDDRTYMAKMIRGREMIHLGALKALNARIENAKNRVSKCELAITKHVGVKW